MIIQSASYLHYPWLWERVGCNHSEAFRAIEAIDPVTHEIVGMVGFDPVAGNSVQMHFAFARPSRRLLIEAFSHVFNHKEAVVGWLPANRTDLRDMAHRLGFEEFGHIPNGHAKGVDLIMVRMTKAMCRYLRRN